jgi:type II secretion system protein J
LSGDNIALEEGELLRLTTSRPEPGIGLVSRPQRVGWRLRDGTLQRVIWNVLDRDQDSRELVRSVLQTVASAEISFFAYSEEGELETIAEWPGGETLPAGVEFLLTLKNGQEYRRLFSVAG